MSTPVARVVVQLIPTEMDDAFAYALKAAGKKAKLRIEHVRCSKDLSSVMDACKWKWADVLDAMGDYQLVIYEEARTDPRRHQRQRRLRRRR